MTCFGIPNFLLRALLVLEIPGIQQIDTDPSAGNRGGGSGYGRNRIPERESCMARRNGHNGGGPNGAEVSGDGRMRGHAGGGPGGVAVETVESVETARWGGLTRERLVEFYRLMYLSRRTDDREIVLKRQQKIFFQVSCAGHEALLVAAAMAMKPGYDWFFPYYRDRALCLALGDTVEGQLLQAVGAADDPASDGRHSRVYREFKKIEFHGDEVVFVSIGEGSTSQGEFWESLNTASNAKLPVVYVIEDNEYAISTPVAVSYTH